MRRGRRIIPAEPVTAARQRCAEGLAELPPAARDLHAPEPVPVTISDALANAQQNLTRQLRLRSAY